MAYINKWTTFSASILCQFGAGLTYTFSLYANDLKEKFGYDQEQIEGLGSALNFGGFFAVVAGLLYDQLAGRHRLGPQLTLTIGALLNLAGYSLLWFGATTESFNPAYWQVLVAGALAANGGTWTDMGALVTNVRNWPTRRGTVVGILKSCVGLSASVFTSMYIGFMKLDALDFLLFIALTPAIINIICLPFINHVPFEQKSEGGSCEGSLSTDARFTIAAQIIFVLALYQMITAVVTNSPHLALTPNARLAITVGTIILISTVIYLPLWSGGFWASPANPTLTDDEERPPSPRTPDIQEQLLADLDFPLPARTTPSAALPGDSLQEGPGGPQETAMLLDKLEGIEPQRMWVPDPDLPSFTPWMCLRSPSFWLLWSICCIGLGSGLVFLNNLGQLVLALGGKEGPAVLVSLFSVMNCAGRIFFGYVPERFLHEFHTPRPAFLIVVAATTAVVNVATAFAPLPFLSVSALLGGFAFGGHWSLMSAITSEVFGLRYFATNYSLIQLAPAMGGLLMATKLVGWLYDIQVARQGGGEVCLGNQCYRLAFLLCALLSVLATTATTVFYFITRQTYQPRANVEPPRRLSSPPSGQLPVSSVLPLAPPSPPSGGYQQVPVTGT